MRLLLSLGEVEATVMRIIGIDPGTYHMGIGVVDADGADCTYVYSEVVSPTKNSPMSQRLRYLYHAVSDVVSRWNPDELAVEEPFAARNVKSAMAIGHAQAVVMLVAAENEMPVLTYAPTQIKQAVTDYGGSSKDQVQEMVRIFLGEDAEYETSDESDALAVAICHASSNIISQLVIKE